MALFSENGELHVFKGHYLSDTQAVTEISLESVPFEVAAVYANDGCHGYMKLRFDDRSIAWFTQNLHKIADAGTRACIWRYFWFLVQDRQMPATQFMSFVENNLVNETVEQIISVALMNLSGLVNSYTPVDRVKDSKSKVFKILLKLLEKGEEIPKLPIIDMLFAFISSDEDLSMCIEWMLAEKIILPGGQEFELVKKN